MKANPTTDHMKRGEFLRSLGLSSAALMSFYCLGTTLTSCSKKDDPAPATPTTPSSATGLTGNTESAKGKIDFTIDLTNATYKGLKVEGGYVKINDVVVADAKGGKYVAVGRYCTHANGNLNYRLATNDFLCDNHGGLFNADGSVKAAPPSKAVKQYVATLSADGNSIRVTE